MTSTHTFYIPNSAQGFFLRTLPVVIGRIFVWYIMLGCLGPFVILLWLSGWRPSPDSDREDTYWFLGIIILVPMTLLALGLLTLGLYLGLDAYTHPHVY